MNIDIFKDDFLLLYMLFVVSVFSIEKFGEKQKDSNYIYMYIWNDISRKIYLIGR
ncbi:MAG: hypothetical protein ACLUZ6_05725 [Lachnospira eligens]